MLAHSLRDAATAKKLAVMVTLDSVSAEAITQLKASSRALGIARLPFARRLLLTGPHAKQTVYDYIIPVPRIRNGSPANLYLMNRPDLHSAFTKINLWKQTQFRKIVYIDADVVAFRAPDELFDIPHAFSAAPDIGWPDLFNSGVMVLTPSMGDYYALMAMADRGISFDGADQGLLNMHFKNTYNRLSFTYNVTPSAHYQYVPAYRHLQSSINMVHFIGSEKPWTRGRDATTGSSPFDEMVGRWWAVYDRHYRRDVSAGYLSGIMASTRPPAYSYSAQTPAPTESQAPSQSPELVQYFVKGEYQPRISYTVPTGEPRQSPGDTSSHGQHYEYVPPQSHFAHHGPPGHNEHHHDHHHEGQQPPHHGPAEDHHHHHQHDQHQHDQHQHHSPHSSDQSQPAASVPHPEQSFSTPSASFSSERTQTEARQGQVPEHQHPPPPPSYEPEHRNQPPQPPPMESSWDAQRLVATPQSVLKEPAVRKLTRPVDIRLQPILSQRLSISRKRTTQCRRMLLHSCRPSATRALPGTCGTRCRRRLLLRRARGLRPSSRGKDTSLRRLAFSATTRIDPSPPSPSCPKPSHLVCPGLRLSRP